MTIDWSKVRTEYEDKVENSDSPEYIDKYIRRKARSGPEWAVAYGLLQVANAITCAAGQIGGVDDYTGIMRLGWGLEELAKAVNGKDKPGKDEP